MFRKFDFIYHFINEDYRICFENDIIKSDIENAIKVFIVKYCLHQEQEDDYILLYNDKIRIDFNVEYYRNFVIRIEVNNVFLMK